MEIDEFGEPTGRKYPITYELLRDQGKNYAKLLRFYLRLCQKCVKSGYAISGHNVGYDLELLSNTWSEFLGGETIEFSEHVVYDTGALFKAATLSLLPIPGETITRYLTRAKNVRAPGVKWNLLHVIESLGLVDKHSLDVGQLHGAGYDAYVSFLLFEELRHLLEGASHGSR